MITRPDYLCELRENIIVRALDGVKTFADLDILPVSTPNVVNDFAQWMIEKKQNIPHWRLTSEEKAADE